MTDMTKNTFKLMFDTETRISYVKKVVDEMDKNHKQHYTEIVTGFMPQILNENG